MKSVHIKPKLVKMSMVIFLLRINWLVIQLMACPGASPKEFNTAMVANVITTVLELDAQISGANNTSMPTINQ